MAPFKEGAMPWKEANVLDLRHEFVLRALRQEQSFSSLCREYGISTNTGYKWKQRFLEAGSPGLLDSSRRPLTSPAALSEDVVCELVRLKQAHPNWGPAKIQALYSRAHSSAPLPSLSSVQRVLGKAGLVLPRKKRRRSADAGRIMNGQLALAPNQVWSVDFKGWWYSTHKDRVLPLTVCDSFSRYILLIQAVPDSRSLTVQRCFDRIFTRYGLPLVIRSDNGTPFACSRAPLGLSQLSVWWLALGIGLQRIAPGRPDQNGSHERMHRNIALEIEGRVKGGLEAQQAAFDLWREEFNTERPHSAIGMRFPAEVYEASPRSYDPRFELDYPAGYLRRKVSNAGSIKLGGKSIMLSSALQHWDVGLKAVAADTFEVWFASLRLGSLLLQDEKFIAARPEVSDQRL
jgi:transposase InsO family protein